LLAMVVGMGGCSSATMLPVAPNVLRDGSGSAQLRALPSELQTPDMRILYATDRSTEGKDERGVVYGYGRSPSVIYGAATVSMGKSVTWEELVDYSGRASGSEKYAMKVTRVEERGRYIPTLDRLEPVNGRLVLVDPEGEQKETLEAQAVLEEALAQAPQKDVYIFVHGFANSFDDAVLRTAGLWHYLGRRGVAIAYTWPAGRGGAFGYFYDRESGEFTIYHLKRLLRLVAACPSVERVHLISHSRGTDVATTALRELNGFYRGGGKDPQVELKLQTLVLAAPDLDLEVFSQRFGSENLIGIARQVVIYASKEDSAIRFARWLFGDGGRLGSVDPSLARPGVMDKLAKLPSMQIVLTEVSGFSTSHAYVFSNPAALSDLVVVLRDGKMPGVENGRPMTRGHGFWSLNDTYFKGTGAEPMAGK
jgi:esterase/lipase superfamily enzyme